MSTESIIDDGSDIERIEFAHEEANKMVRAMRKKIFRNNNKIQKWVKTLKEKNAINDQGAHGFTLLMHGVMTMRPKVIALLVESGADPTVPSNNGLAPVHVAAELDKPIYLEPMLINQEVVNSTNPNHSLTPLHHAVMGAREDNINLLLDKGANINATGSTNATPLANALAPTDFPIARLLLSRGADPFMKNNVGISFVDHLNDWDKDRNILNERGKANLDKTLALFKELYPESIK